MDIVTMVVGLPVAPVRGVAALIQVLIREAERELYDPARARSQIEEIEAAAAAGEISAEDKEQAEREILGRLVQPSDRPQSGGG
jgi:hypothetical protein